MPGIVSSHGTSGYPTAVVFGNVGIGYLTDFDVDAQAGQVFEKTNVSSPVIGTGADARVLKQYDCTSIEPPTISLRFWGPPSFSMFDCGKKALIEFDAPGDYISGEAILVSWKHAGRAGQWSTGEAVFRLTGVLQ
jgi:hypothetical protein